MSPGFSISAEEKKAHTTTSGMSFQIQYVFCLVAPTTLFMELGCCPGSVIRAPLLISRVCNNRHVSINWGAGQTHPLYIIRMGKFRKTIRPNFRCDTRRLLGEFRFLIGVIKLENAENLVMFVCLGFAVWFAREQNCWSSQGMSL